MEIINNKDFRLRQAILNGSSKKLQEYFKEKDLLECKLINCYENSYKFMNFHLIIKLEEIKDIRKVAENLLEISNFTINDEIPLANVENEINKTSVLLIYLYKEDKFYLIFENEELKKIENIELDNDFKEFVKDISIGKITSFLKKCLYKYNVEDKIEF